MFHPHIVAAVSNKVRLNIIELLSVKSLTAGEIAAEFNMAWPSISRHLSILKCSKIIFCEKKGKNLVYSLNIDFFKEVSGWFNGIINTYESNLNQHRRSEE